MLKFSVILKHLLSDEEGQDLVEYALILALIALACITGVGGFGAMLQGLTDTIGTAASKLLS
jgi:pilus assembly protein Flp/PilA